MSGSFQQGATVTVLLHRNNIFPFQTAPSIEDVTITHAPADTGDCFHFTTKDGTPFLINPMASDFIGLLGEKPANA